MACVSRRRRVCPIRGAADTDVGVCAPCACKVVASHDARVRGHKRHVARGIVNDLASAGATVTSGRRRATGQLLAQRQDRTRRLANHLIGGRSNSIMSIGLRPWTPSTTMSALSSASQTRESARRAFSVTGRGGPDASGPCSGSAASAWPAVLPRLSAPHRDTPSCRTSPALRSPSATRARARASGSSSIRGRAFWRSARR